MLARRRIGERSRCMKFLKVVLLSALQATCGDSIHSLLLVSVLPDQHSLSPSEAKMLN